MDMKQAFRHEALVRHLTEMIFRLQRPGKQPLLIAFGGEGNCRKTTIAKSVRSVVVQSKVSMTILEIDDYAHPRSLRLASRYSGYNPAAFDIAAFHQDIRSLLLGQSIRKPYYDHSKGEICGYCGDHAHSHEVTSSDVVLAIGVYPDRLFGETGLQPSFSVLFMRKGFLRFLDRIKRDTSERGYSVAVAALNYRRMRHDFRKFMTVAREWYNCVCIVRKRRYNWLEREERCG